MENYRMKPEMKNNGEKFPELDYNQIYRMRGPTELENNFVDGQEANREGIFCRKNLPNYIMLGILGASAATLAGMGLVELVIEYIANK